MEYGEFTKCFKQVQCQYAEFDSSRLQKEAKYGGNGKK